MLNLLAKDFKLIFAKKDSVKKQILSSIFSVLVIAILIAIETFIFQVLLNKIKNYYQAPISFLTLFLFNKSIAFLITIIELVLLHKILQAFDASSLPSTLILILTSFSLKNLILSSVSNTQLVWI